MLAAGIITRGENESVLRKYVKSVKKRWKKITMPTTSVAILKQNDGILKFLYLLEPGADLGFSLEGADF